MRRCVSFGFGDPLLYLIKSALHLIRSFATRNLSAERATLSAHKNTPITWLRSRSVLHMRTWKRKKDREAGAVSMLSNSTQNSYACTRTRSGGDACWVMRIGGQAVKRRKTPDRHHEHTQPVVTRAEYMVRRGDDCKSRTQVRGRVMVSGTGNPPGTHSATNFTPHFSTEYGDAKHCTITFGAFKVLPGPVHHFPDSRT